MKFLVLNIPKLLNFYVLPETKQTDLHLDSFKERSLVSYNEEELFVKFLLLQHPKLFKTYFFI